MRFALIAAVMTGALSLPAAAQETRTFTDDAGRTVEVPADPQRVASLGGKLITNLLIELGVTPVGTQADLQDGVVTLQNGPTLTGTFMADGEMAFLGQFPIDVEAVAAVKPDLIILPNWQEGNTIEQFETIAPTVYVDIDARVGQDLAAFLADLTGTEERRAVLDRRYEAQIAMLRGQVDTESITVSTFRPIGGTIRILHPLMVTGQVLEDAGFSFPEFYETFERGVDDISLSAEFLQQLDADFIVMPFATTPQAVYDEMEDLFPGWCDVMSACRDGNIIYLPAFEATSSSYDFATALIFVMLVETVRAGN
ncbi:MAG: ABC transporter substrate-binding protein [Pseudomonadota bacterium]